MTASFQLDPSAIAHVERLMRDAGDGPIALRVTAAAHGPAALRNDLAFVPLEAADDDVRLDFGPVPVLVDARSLVRLRGVTLRYEEHRMGGGFRFDGEAAAPDGDGDPVAARVRALLDDEVNPGLSGHGGRVTLVEVRDGAAFVVMEGGCQGCGQARATLDEGIARHITERVPEVSRVVDLTDHQAGTSPYFPQASHGEP